MTTPRLLTLDDLDPWLDLQMDLIAENGRGGALPFSPYEPGDDQSRADFAERTRTRWATPLDQPGWRRAWGVIERGRIVAEGELTGGSLRTELHRAQLGIGVAREHRGRGLGRAITEAIIEWARAEPHIAWIDLGVFAGNDVAERLYRNLGFAEAGRVIDRFRVNERRIEDIWMCLNVEV